MRQADPAARRLGLGVLVAYGLPALPLAALTLPLYIVVPTFYAETLGVPLATVGAVLLAIRAFDAVNDPAIGWLADRYPRRNRRKVWLGAAALPAAAAAFALFWPPATAGGTWLALTAAALSIGYSALVLPLSAWGAELSKDYDERSTIVAWREGFVIAGTLVAIALPFTIGWEDADAFHGLALIAVFVAAVMPVAVAVALWCVPEPAAPEKRGLGLGKGLALMRQNTHFQRLIAAFFVNSLANALPATLFLLFVSSVLASEGWRGPLLMLYFASAVAGMPLWAAIARRLDKHHAWCIAMIANCVFFAPAFLLGAGDVAVFAVICVLTGLCLGADLVLPASMQADVIETDAIKAGESRAALFFAAWSLATKLALALAIGIGFPLLSAAGFDAAEPARSTASGLGALSALYALAPVALKAIAIVMMWNYPLTKARLLELRQADSA